MSAYPVELLVQRGLIDAKCPFIQKPFEHDACDEKVRAALATPAT